MAEKRDLRITHEKVDSMIIQQINLAEMERRQIIADLLYGLIFR